MPTTNRKVDQFTKEGQYIKSWNSAVEAARSFGGDGRNNNIAHAAKHHRVCNGFRWAHTNEVILGELWKISELGLNVSDKGRIEYENGRISSGSRSPAGYMTCNTKGKTYLVHRIIAKTFIVNDRSEAKYVDHINRRRWDNRVSNLRWVTHAENCMKKSNLSNHEYGSRIMAMIRI